MTSTAAPDNGLPSDARLTRPRSAPSEMTVNGTPLLAASPTVTTTGPVVAPAGTGAVMLVAAQAVVVAAAPLNVTRPPAAVEPKLDPVMVMSDATEPDAGERPVISGGSLGIGTTMRESYAPSKTPSIVSWPFTL